MQTIAIVLNTSWNIYNFRLNLMKSLSKEGYRVVAIAPKDEYSSKLEEEGFEWIELGLDNDSTNPLKELMQIKMFLSVYKNLRPDFLLQYTIKPNIYGTLAAKVLGIPVINNVSGLGTIFLNKGLSSKIAKILYRFSFRFADDIFFQNRDDQKVFLKHKMIKVNRSHVIPGSGINSKRFAPIAVTKSKEDKVVFLMIARLIGEKGVLDYIDAIKILKQKKYDLKFLLIGSLYPKNPSAISEALLNEWIEDGIIEYLPFSDKMEEVIARADCVVLPSYREGLSRVLLEAASMEKPIVTTDVAGCRDVVEHGVNGFLCDVRNALSLATQMEKFVQLSFEEREKMGILGRKKILNEFEETVVIEKYMSTIKNRLQIGMFKREQAAKKALDHF